MTIIPEVIITTHILRHLPSKSVGRFRCVSKKWLSLLTDPQFIQTHQKTLNVNRLFFICCDGFLYTVPYDHHEAVSTPTKLVVGSYTINFIHGSVNGLVLATGTAVKDFQISKTLLLLNLTTKDYVELPCQKLICSTKGFGYDSVSGDYKVVVITNKFENDYGNAYIYNLRTNTMKLVISNTPYVNYGFHWSPRVFVNGFLHWIMSKDSKPVIVAFSLADEKLSELPLPNFYRDMSAETKFVALGKNLAIFDGANGDIWMMNEYGVQKSWKKIVVQGFNETRMYYPLVYFDSGRVLFRTGDLLLIYDVEERTFCRSVDISSIKHSPSIGAYAESLVSPKFSTPK